MARILVIDDSKTEQLVISKTLSEAGHDTLSAFDGEEGLQKIGSYRPDLVILDVIMPGKNGFEVCRTIKRDEQNKAIPVIMLTLKSQESDKFWGLKQGADEYLVKPFKPEDLLKTVSKYIK